MAIVLVNEALPIRALGGLEPSVWLCVGSGFAREELKSNLANSGLGWVSSAITHVHDLVLKITQIPKERILSPGARLEVIRKLLSEKRILDQLPELKKLKRKPRFDQRLDQSLQAGRLTFAHDTEEDVYQSHLSQSGLLTPLWREFRALSLAFDAWLEANDTFDLPRLLRLSIQILESSSSSSSSQLGNWFEWPKEIWLLSVQNPESLEKLFFERLSERLSVKHLRIPERGSVFPGPKKLNWLRTHTLDDGAEFLFDELQTWVGPNFNWNDFAILIPDIPAVRRSLIQVAERRNIPLADPRDPTRLRWEESIKWALAPLEVVAQNFNPLRVISYLLTWMSAITMTGRQKRLIQVIYDRAIQGGLSSYEGGELGVLHQKLSVLHQDFWGRKTVRQFSENHLKILKASPDCEPWILQFFEGAWASYVADLASAGRDERQAPLFYWLEQFRQRIQTASPPVTQLKSESGLQIYRLQQTPSRIVKKTWIFGMPSHWLRGQGAGDDWFSDRIREVLSGEFAVRSSIQVREERLEILKAWMAHSTDITLYDARYEVQGRERDSLYSCVKECATVLNILVQAHPSELGAHPRMLPSYRSQNDPASSAVTPVILTPPDRLEITASELDRYTRCPFQALVYHRWRLEDLRLPSAELRPDVKGALLHQAVREMVKNFTPESDATFTSPELFQPHPPGLYRTKLIYYYNRLKLEKVLKSFWVRDLAYRKRSGAVPLSLDDQSLFLQFDEFTVVGRPDRIDQHADGVFIIEYKSSSSSPSGQEMAELGYRLQLPVYALAARRQLKQPVLGAQFVELTRAGSRASGVFFKEWNGSQDGKLTQARSNSRSLFQEDSNEIWDQLETHILKAGKLWSQGIFTPVPKCAKPDQECKNCKASGLCGHSRRSSLG